MKQTIRLIELINLYKINGISLFNKIDDINVISKMVKVLDNAYYINKKPFITNIEYDILVEFIKNTYGDKIQIGYKNNILMGNKEELPYYMASMDKIKPDTKALKNWKKKYSGNSIVSGKVDGISALYSTENGTGCLYTRGNGKIGRNISYFIPYLNLPYIKDITLRGEIIMRKDIFQKKYMNKFATIRNLVGGIINGKTINKEIMKDIDFICYEVIRPILKPSDQIEWLNNNYNGNIIINKTFNNNKLNNVELSKILKKWRNGYEYEIDGIIINNDKIYERKNENPKHAFAFKMVLSDQIMEAMVVDVLYEPSIYGYMIPRIRISPINIGGSNIEYCTGHNAGYIRNNSIGIGSIIEIRRSGDVIPSIHKVLKKSDKPKLPNIECIWGKSGIDLILKDIINNKTVKLKRIHSFFNSLNIGGLGRGNIKRIIEGGYDSIYKILSMTIDNFMDIDGFKVKLSNKILNNINNKMSNIKIYELMNASNIFGRGMGMRTLKLIVDKYPNILSSNDNSGEKINKLSNIPGLGVKKAVIFINNMDEFIEFMDKLPLKNKMNITSDI